jgi:polyhydroxyalkanoate synthesis regulator phasin
VSKEDKSATEDRLVKAYEQMLERVRDTLHEAEEATPKLRAMLDKARDHMVELGELTREEAQKISGYLERDIEDASQYLAETGEDLRAWWRFDLELIEQRMLDAFTSVADQTSLQLKQWSDRARQASLYQAGQITGPGTLACDRCGAETRFTRAGRIPPCADCGGLSFRRVQKNSDNTDDAVPKADD